MHMADALLSPGVGGAMWGVAAGIIISTSVKVKREIDDRRIPLMGVLGAFVFAAQMINFTIPGTGSSGHLGGGLLLAILLGPHAGFLTIASVLVVQSLFFADGGILALGCNIVNLGVFPAFISYTLIYRPLAGIHSSRGRVSFAAILAAVVGLQLGAFAVVLETVASGITALPFATFAALMQPIHLAIGIVEGLVTAAVVSFVSIARPEIIWSPATPKQVSALPLRRIVLPFLAAALLISGVISWFASENPDGLEWAIAGVTGKDEVPGSEGGLHQALASLQENTAFLPDYSFGQAGEKAAAAVVPGGGAGEGKSERLGTTVSGLIGALLCLGMVFGLGLLLRKREQRA